MTKEINVLVLAYLGDTIYERYIREYLVLKNISKVKDLQIEAIKYVSAKNQCLFVKKMIDEDFFSDEEKNIVFRARNHKSHKSPKNTDVSTYKYATGLEALIGYLYLEKKTNRIDEIMEWIIGE